MSSAKKLPPIENVKAAPGKMIVVGCKMPNGLHLDFNEVGKPLKRVTLNGANSSNVIGGYGITRSVPEDFFNEWMRRNREHPAVVNGLIFAHKDASSVKDEARSRAELKHGLEPIDPKRPGAGIKSADPKLRDNGDNGDNEDD